jgi:DNA-binding XRE family transcriptional regulator
MGTANFLRLDANILTVREIACVGYIRRSKLVPEMTETVADLVRRLRTERGRGGKKLTQAGLAQLAGVSRDTIVAIESNSERQPGFATIVSVLLALGVEIYNLKTGEPVKPNALPQKSRADEELWQRYATLSEAGKRALAQMIDVLVAERPPPPAAPVLLPARRKKGRKTK